MKNQKGITLVALIITIIVMLILAGVIITAAVADGGVIDRAQSAIKEKERAEVEEIVKTSYVYKTTASTNMAGKLDLEKTAKSICSNLIESGYEVLNAIEKEENGETYKTLEVKVDEKMEIVVEGKNGKYTGVVDKSGLKNGIVSVEETGNNTPPVNEEIEISAEKDLLVVGYFYNTMYNPEQPEIINVDGYEDDENDDKVSDKNASLSAYTSGYDLDIPVSFFAENVPTEGDIQVTVTHYNGREENVILKQATNKRWEYESMILTGKEDDVMWEEYIAFDFYPYAKQSNSPSRYEESTEYHYLSIDAGNAVPFQKITMFGKTIEFPFNCQAYIGWEDEWLETIDPLYTNISDVSEVIVNYSDGSNKSYKKENIYDSNLYYSDDSCFYYSSQDIPILYIDGAFIINMQESNFKNSITSIVVVENGVAKKFNIASDTQIISSNAWN